MSNAGGDKRKVRLVNVTQEKKDLVDKVMENKQIKTAIMNCQQIRPDIEIVDKSDEGAWFFEMSALEKKLAKHRPLIEMPKISSEKSGEVDKRKQEVEEEMELVSWMDDKTTEKVYEQSEIQILQTMKSKIDLELTNKKLKKQIVTLESERENLKKRLSEYESKKMVNKNLCKLCGINEINTFLVPCHHSLYCLKCIEHEQECKDCGRCLSKILILELKREHKDSSKKVWKIERYFC